MTKKITLSRILTTVFLGLFIWYGYTNRGLFTSLKDVTIFTLVVVALGKLLIHVVNGQFTKWTVEIFTKKLPLTETVYVAILSAIGNYFGPLLGGTSIRAVYLKKTHNLSYSNFTSTVAGYYLVIFIANSVIAITSLLFLDQTDQTLPLLVFFCLWLIFLLGLTIVKLPKKERFSKLMQRNRYLKFFVTVIYDIEMGWHELIKNKRLMARLMFLGFCGFLITFVLTYVEFKAIGVTMSLAALGLYTSLFTASMLISLTPGAIGIREAILLLVSTTIGVTNEQILQVALIDRGVNFIVLLVLFLLVKLPITKQVLKIDNAAL